MMRGACKSTKDKCNAKKAECDKLPDFAQVDSARTDDSEEEEDPYPAELAEDDREDDEGGENDEADDGETTDDSEDGTVASPAQRSLLSERSGQRSGKGFFKSVSK